jgi:hypothetical protein
LSYKDFLTTELRSLLIFGGFIINSALDYVILRPIAIGYTKIVPAPFANKIENFIENFYTPLKNEL